MDEKFLGFLRIAFKLVAGNSPSYEEITCHWPSSC